MGSTKKDKHLKKQSKSLTPAQSPKPTSSPHGKKRKHDEQEDDAPPTVTAVVGPLGATEASGEDDEEEDGIAGEEDGEEQTLSKAAKGKAKKRRKEEQRALENPPAFSFDTRGFKGGRMIKVQDVRDFVLHLLSDEKAQQWLYVANKRNVRRVVSLMIPGITPATLGVASPSLASNMPFGLASTTSQLPVFQTLFSHACPTKAPGERNRMHSCYQAFTTTPLTGGEKDRREKARKAQGQTERTSDPSAYLLSHEQMTEQAYPVPSPIPSTIIDSPTFDDWKRPDGWIEAPYMKPTGGIRRVLGLDCEMCLTEDGSELTRLSVVDSKGKRIFDSLVKPDKPILDYLTRYSGLTAEKLENVTTKLADIQASLATLLDHNTILLGHSLECDLRVLKLIHPWVIDTSVIYQHPRGPPFKASLKWLAQKWLKKEIQNVTASELSVGGHDSEEDARTCVELLQLKMQKGPGFGEFVTDQETIFERIARGPEPKTSAVIDHGTPGQWHGAKAQTTIACSTDDEILDGMISSLGGHDFTIGRFMELSHGLGWSQPTNAALGKSSSTLPGIAAAPILPL
ncbi:RNA exonuclease, partial [Phenoliferia sp. Uapishka_3]